MQKSHPKCYPRDIALNAKEEEKEVGQLRALQRETFVFALSVTEVMLGMGRRT